MIITKAKMEEYEMKKYTAPEIEIEYLGFCEDIMSASMVVSSEEDDTLKGVVDIEALLAKMIGR